MNTKVASCAETPSAARLVIHDEREVDGICKYVEYQLKRLRALYSDRPGHDRAPLKVEINDLQGCRVLAIDNAGSLIDVPLPAGTYHVTAHLGKLRRGYTMTLQQGESLDLHLRLSPDRQ